MGGRLLLGRGLRAAGNGLSSRGGKCSPLSRRLQSHPCPLPCRRYIMERATRGLRSLGVANSTDDGATWQLAGLIR